MKKTGLWALAFWGACIANAQVIPAARLVDWSKAGVESNIAITDTFSIVDFGGVNDGVTPNDLAVQAMIQAAQNRPAVFYFPAGSYVFTQGIDAPDSTHWMGAGATKTRLLFDLGNTTQHLFRVQGGSVGAETPVIAGFTKDNNWLTVNDVSLFSAGSYVEIRQENGSWDTNPASWATQSVGQILKIDRVAGDTLWFTESLRLDYDTSLALRARTLDLAQHVSFSCFYIERLTAPATGAGYNFLLDRAANCSILGIESGKSLGSHVMIELSTHCSVAHSYFHHAFTYDGSGTRGYGVTINNHAGLNLVENNIFKFLRHAMMVKHGANGNVFAYNYSREPNRSEPIADYSGDISLHGHYPFANLFEGNCVQMVMIDHYWGPSGPWNTFVRNRVEGYGIIITAGDSITAYQQFVGNETTNTGFFMGQFSLNGAHHFLYGNSILNTIQPPGTGDLRDTSYYRTTVPDYWYTPAVYPSVGVPNLPNQYTIPAKARYEQGVYALCEPTALGTPTVETHALESTLFGNIYPNPGKGHIYFSDAIAGITVYTLWGQPVPVHVQSSNQVYITPATAGMYWLRVIFESGVQRIFKYVYQP